MELNEYQEKALETAIYPEQYRVIYPALGLAGEAGECVEKVKKWLRGDDGGAMSEDRKRLIGLELGDVLWYVATLAHDIGYSMEEIGEMNYAKLSKRQKEGKLSGDGDER